MALLMMEGSASRDDLCTATNESSVILDWWKPVASKSRKTKVLILLQCGFEVTGVCPREEGLLETLLMEFLLFELWLFLLVERLVPLEGVNSHAVGVRVERVVKGDG